MAETTTLDNQPIEAPQAPPAQGTPAYNAQEIQSSFAGLAPQQQEAVGGVEGFQQQEAVIGSLPKMVEPKAINGTTKAEEFVDKSTKELQDIRDRQATADERRTQIPDSTIQPTGDSETDATNQQLDVEAKQGAGLLDRVAANSDTRTANRIKQIQEQFTRLRDQMQTANSNRLASLEIIGGRQGRQRYAQEIQSSILSAEEKAGIQRIADLHAQEEQLILEAEQANEDMQLKVLFEKMSLIKETRREKEAAIDRAFNKMMALEDLAMKKAQEQKAELSFQSEEARREVQFEREGIIFNQDQAQRKVDSLLASNTPLYNEKGELSFDPEQISRIEEESGMVSGTFEGYYQNLLDSKTAEKAGNLIESDIKLIGALKDIPGDRIVTIGGKQYLGLKKADKPTTVGNPKDGVWEKNADGTWTQVVAPSSGTANDIISDSVAEKLGVPFGSTRAEANKIIKQKNIEKETSANKIIDEFNHVLENNIERVNSILDNPALDEIVGPYFFTRLHAVPFHKDDRNRALGEIENLISQEVINTLQNAKNRGATFGALSDAELDLLRQSANVITNWIKTDYKKDGTTVDNKWIEIDEKTFMDEVTKLKNEMNRQIARAYNFEGVEDLKLQYEDKFGTTFSEKNIAEQAQQIRDEMKKPPQDLKQYLQKYPVDKQKVEVFGDEYPPDEVFDFLMEERGFSNDLSSSLNNSNKIGLLSEKYESGGDPGAIGYDSTGGWSYGAYQLAHNNAEKFVSQSSYQNEFKGIPFNSEQYRNKWKEVASKDAERFKQEQKEYIKKTHFDPQINKLASANIDVSRFSPVLQDVIWSTAVQHGASTNIIKDAIKQAGPNATEDQIINKIYDLRWSGGKMFTSNTSQVKSSVQNRFNNERRLALSQLNNQRVA